MDRIEAVEKAKAILGDSYRGLQQLIDIDSAGKESMEFTVFWRKSHMSNLSNAYGPSWETMIERLKESMKVPA